MRIVRTVEQRMVGWALLGGLLAAAAAYRLVTWMWSLPS